MGCPHILPNRELLALLMPASDPLHGRTFETLQDHFRRETCDQYDQPPSTTERYAEAVVRETPTSESDDERKMEHVLRSYYKAVDEVVAALGANGPTPRVKQPLIAPCATLLKAVLPEDSIEFGEALKHIQLRFATQNGQQTPEVLPESRQTDGSALLKEGESRNVQKAVEQYDRMLETIINAVRSGVAKHLRETIRET